jgi:EAL domain-containing protein (putative c-di-GMP-specific phosphodiesterase class I)
MGFKISIDNFGGNNSSVEYLKYLPLDLVKFDIEFTKNLEDERYLKLLKFYISMLKELKIKVMIKFIDKKSIFETIQRYNPDFIQGFIVSKPKNLKQIKDML